MQIIVTPSLIYSINDEGLSIYLRPGLY